MSDAAVSLRAAAAQPDDHVPVSREFVFNAVAKLLEAMGEAIGHGADEFVPVLRSAFERGGVRTRSGASPSL